VLNDGSKKQGKPVSVIIKKKLAHIFRMCASFFVLIEGERNILNAHKAVL